MKIRLLTFAVTFISVKYATFAKHWDLGTILLISVAVMILAIVVFEIGKSLFWSGRIGTIFTILVILGVITFVADEFYHVGWYLDFRSSIANNTFAIVAVGVTGRYFLILVRRILTSEEEQ